MGNTLSDWTGVTIKTTTSSNYMAQEYDLYQISMTNSIKTGGNTSINDSARDNSTFKGKITFLNGDSGSIERCNVVIVRLIERDEQTEDDGSIQRIENGRSLKGTYYQKDGTGINFTVELQGAINSLVGCIGLTLASSALLLAF